VRTAVRTVAAALLSAMLTTVAALPAQALSTKHFGISATGESAAVLVPSGRSPVTEQFELDNLTGRPLAISLGLRSVSLVGGELQAGSSVSPSGFAEDVRLPDSPVRLAPRQHRLLPLVIDRHTSTTKQYAEITASEATDASTTAPPLTLLVVLEPAIALEPSSSGDGGGIAALAAASVLIAAVLVSLVVVGRRLRTGH
jgi:hypothetical protein